MKPFLAILLMLLLGAMPLSSAYAQVITDPIAITITTTDQPAPAPELDVDTPLTVAGATDSSNVSQGTSDVVFISTLTKPISDGVLTNVVEDNTIYVTSTGDFSDNFTVITMAGTRTNSVTDLALSTSSRSLGSNGATTFTSGATARET